MRELFNNLPEFIFMGSVIGFYIITLIFIIVLFISEVNENGWAALVSFIIFSLAMRFLGNFQIEEYVTIKMIGVYIGVGLIHSVIRTYFYGRKRGLKRKEELVLNPNSNMEYFDLKTINILKGSVFRWWFLFPISFLTWVFSDLLSDFWNTVYDLTKKSFEYILNLGINSIK